MNNDYQLEDAEEAAVNKSKNLKRGLAAGAAILGVGGVSAYGATVLNNENSDVPADEAFSEEELTGAAQAVAEAATEEDAPQEQPKPTPPAPEPVPLPEPEPELTVDESTIVYDEDGNIIATYDTGTYDGKDYIILDTDGNGMGDMVAYDANGNGLYEDNEISYLDNQSYEVGHGNVLAVHQYDEYGNTVEIYRGTNTAFHQLTQEGKLVAENPDDEWPTNDFDPDDKTGEVYEHDLAENNPDYENNGGEQYASNEEYYDEPDYGYTDPSGDLASYDTPDAGYDDVTYDA